MENVNLIIALVLLIISLATGGLAAFMLSKYLKNDVESKSIFQKPFIYMFYALGGFALSLFLFFIFITLGKVNEGAPALNTWLNVGLGGFAFSFGLPISIFSFLIHYYKWNVQKWGNNKAKLVFAIALPITIIGLLSLLSGLTYGGLITYLNNSIKIGPISIAFYALFILTGALITYFISDHEFFKKYGRHGILENVFYVAFPAGIVGARIWFVIGEFNKPQGSSGLTFAQDPLAMFRIWKGGLAIMGGVLFGAAIGILFLIFRRKQYSLTFTIDTVVPAILVAQAIGRWGNFFNQEVFGGTIAADHFIWNFIPYFVKNNMLIDGVYKLPLAFIEFVINLAGFFVIKYAVGKGLKKHTRPLDLALLYVVWYGLTRVVLEPLRDSTYQMGGNNNFSLIWAWTFFALGIVGIIVNHVVSHIMKKKNKIEKVA